MDNLVYKNEAKYWKAIYSAQKFLLETQGFIGYNMKKQLSQIVQYDIIKLFHPDTVNEDTYCLREKGDTIKASYRRNCFLIDKQSSSSLNEQ